MSLVVLGCSAGGLRALETVLGAVPAGLPTAWLVVQHRATDADDFLARHLEALSALSVEEGYDKAPLRPGLAYVAPGGYHLLVERDETISMSLDPPLHHCRPAIDVTLETAAAAYGPRVCGVLMTGANLDGVEGLRAVRARGGRTLVQDPATAEASVMPKGAVDAGVADEVLGLGEMAAAIARAVRAWG